MNVDDRQKDPEGSPRNSAATVTQGQAWESSGMSSFLHAFGLSLACLVLKNVHSELLSWLTTGF